MFIVKGRVRRAFTLIEMLVVVAVIALLIAILLPILGAVTLSAMQVECKTNLKSLADASHAYATANDGQFLPGPGNGLSLQTIQAPGGDISYRQRWEGYLTNYSVEKGSVSMYCPFFEDDAYHSLPSGWNNYNTPDRFGPGYYWMGYANFAHPGNTPSANPNRYWRAAEAGPSVIDATPGDMPLFGDVIEGNVDGNETDWVHYSHTEGRVLSGGGATARSLKEFVGPDGFHNAYADGSVQWTDFQPNGDEIEVSYSAQRQGDIGFLWNYESQAP